MSDPRITVVPGLCGGRPTIRGLRITVADVLELLAGGMSHDDIVADYPYLEREDIVYPVSDPHTGSGRGALAHRLSLWLSPPVALRRRVRRWRVSAPRTAQA